MLTILAIEMPGWPALLVVLTVVGLVSGIMYCLHRTLTMGEQKDLARLPPESDEPERFKPPESRTTSPQRTSAR